MELSDVILQIAQGLSTISAAWMIQDIIRMPKITNIQKFLLFIGIGCIISGFSDILLAVIGQNQFNCIITMFGDALGQQISITVSSVMGIFAYRSIVSFRKFNHDLFVNMSIIIFIVIDLFLDALPLLPFFYFNYGYSEEDGCLFVPANSSEQEFFWAVILTGVLEFFPFLVISLVYYIRLVWYIKTNFKDLLQTKSQIKVERLFWYPLVQFICFFPSVCWYLYFIGGGKKDWADEMYIAAELAAASAGLLTTILYILITKGNKNDNQETVTGINLSMVVHEEDDKTVLEKALQNRSLSDFNI